MDLGINRTLLAFSVMIMLAVFHLIYLIPLSIYGEVLIIERITWIARFEVGLTALILIFALERWINFIRFMRSIRGPFG